MFDVSRDFRWDFLILSQTPAGFGSIGLVKVEV